MKRLTASILIPLWALVICLAAAPADMLSRCASKLSEAPCLYVTYSVKADGHSSEGQLVVQGEKFTVNSPGLRSWYDGKTQWTYSSQMGEVNIITPTPEEVRQINPIAIIKAFRSDYKVTPLTAATPGHTSLRLTAKNSASDIIAAEITIDDKTLYPTRVVLTMSNNQKVTIAIQAIRAGKRIPDSNFRFDKKLFPGINVVDLR